MLAYQDHINRGLTGVKDERAVCEKAQLEDLDLVIFSDHHRGDKTGADDFAACEEVYHDALKHYHEKDFRLLLLGDVEELWECSPGKVVEVYEETLLLEQSFHEAGGYVRLYGNHDDVWTTVWELNRHLAKYIQDETGSFAVHEAYLLKIYDGKEYLGEILLTHGHQGTPDSDRFAFLSRFLVRYVWRPIQRLLLIGSNTPSQDFDLRMKHEMAMHNWAVKQDRLILVTGHTHHPVFSSHTMDTKLRLEVEDLRGRLREETVPDTRLLLEQALAVKEYEFARQAEVEDRTVEATKGQPVRPCFFNAGCCSFSDGNITGIEISGGELRLVRWTRFGGTAERRVLQRADLRSLFEACGCEE